MATLYEIDNALRDVIERGFSVDPDTGEVLFDSGDLGALQDALGAKLEGCALWMKEQKALAAAIREEERALAARRKAIEGRLEQMDAYVTGALRSFDGMRYETPRAALGVRRSARAVVDVPEALPDGFVEAVVTRKVDKAKIKRALAAGKEVPGAHLETRLNLQLK